MTFRNILAASLLTVLLLAPVPAVCATTSGRSAADSTEAIKRVRLLLHNRYRAGGMGMLRWSNSMGYAPDPLEQYCDGGRGFICTGGDPDAGTCDVGTMCHLPEGHLIDVLKELARENPASGFLNGQAVYALVKFGRNVEAMAVADACEADEWFCEALKGYAFDADRRNREAETHLRAAMAAAPDSVRCAYTDATWLLGTWEQRNLSLVPPDVRRDVRKWTCPRLEAVSDTLWWLSDPLYSVPGNGRWEEHVVRSLSARFAREIRQSSPPERGPGEFLDYLWARRVRRGVWDSWEHLRSPRGYDRDVGTVVWTSDARAAYHFVPDVDIEDLVHPTWSLDAHRENEGFTPDGGPVQLMPVQLARFRAGDSLEVAGAADLRETSVAGALDLTTRLVLTDGPGSFPASVPGDATRRDTPVFVARARARTYVVGVEAVTSRGNGWFRDTMEPLTPEGVTLSDLLLYDPGPEEPTTVKAAAGHMLGSATLAKGARVGVFWQTYGAPVGAAVDFDLSVERASGRLVEHLTRMLEGRAQDLPGRLTWSEPAQGSVDTRAVTLNLGDLDDGEYVLVLRVSWAGQAPLERRRTFTVE